MKYKYFLSALQCNRVYSNFIKNCGLRNRSGWC